MNPVSHSASNSTPSSGGLSAVGVIPAAGEGRRIQPLPGSKELFPIGSQSLPEREGARPRVVSQHLLEAMKAGGVDTVYWVLREGKWDIPTYWGDGQDMGMHFAYLIMRWPYGVPFTIDQAYPFVQDRIVLTGFPDTLFQPVDAFRALREKLTETQAHVVLGCMPVEDPSKVDVVERASDGTVQAIHVKPDQTSLREAWSLAAWGPTFSDWLHDRIRHIVVDPDRRMEAEANEQHLGHLFQDAMDEGLSVQSVSFPEGRFLDIGTPDALETAMTTPLTDLEAWPEASSS